MDNGKSAEKRIVINVAEIFHILRRKLWIIVIISALFAGLGGFYTTIKETVPMYKTTTKLYITGVETAVPSAAGFSLGQQVINNYIQILRSRPVLEEVINKLDLNMSYWDLLSCLSEKNPSGTCMLEISVIFPDPYWAKVVADEIVLSSATQALEVMGSNPPIVYEEANVPTKAYNDSNINVVKYMVFGGVGGACVALFAILISYFLNSHLATPDRIEEKLNLETLGIIPKCNSKEAYRAFYSNIKFKTRDAKVVAFIHTVTKGNNSEILKEWAKYMSQIGKKVIYINADLYNKHLKNPNKGEHNKKGLKDYLEGRAELQEIVFRKETEKYAFICSDEPCENSCDLLSSDKFSGLLSQLKSTYDYVLLDTPLPGNSVDTFIVAKSADVTLMEISATKSKVYQVRELKEQMEKDDIKITGVVLKDVSVIKSGKHFIRKYARYFY